MNAIERDVRGATAAHANLLAALQSLTDDKARSGSLLPAWTVGHVVTHVARNADSNVLMLDAANRGEVSAQYPGGAAQRNADIEAGAGRSAADLVADVAAACARLEAAWARMSATGWQGTGETIVGRVPIGVLPFRRWRETVVHHADCGFTSDGWRDWPTEYVRLELQQMTMLWASRKPMGLTTLPAQALAVDDHHRLAWLMGRAPIDGLPSAGIY